MQLRLIVSLIVFLGSYFPLSLILLAQDLDYSVFNADGNKSILEAICNVTLKHPVLSLSILGICLVCLSISIFVLQVIAPKTPIQIRNATHVPAELMNYTLPYIVSFMSIDYQQTEKFIGLIIFLGWMFLITHRSGQIFMNPVLIVFGWRHYEIKYTFINGNHDFVGSALSKGRLEPNLFCKLKAFQDILIIKINQ